MSGSMLIGGRVANKLLFGVVWLFSGFCRAPQRRPSFSRERSSGRTAKVGKHKEGSVLCK